MVYLFLLKHCMVCHICVYVCICCVCIIYYVYVYLLQFVVLKLGFCIFWANALNYKILLLDGVLPRFLA